MSNLKNGKMYRNLYIKIENFSVLPGSEIKLIKGLELGCAGIITATCNVTAPLARQVYDDFINNNEQTKNENIKNLDIKSIYILIKL